MGLLPDALWRFAVELAILSTEFDPLPEPEDIMWILHIDSPSKINEYIDALLTAQIIDYDGNNNIVLAHLKDAAYDLQTAKENMENILGI